MECLYNPRRRRAELLRLLSFGQKSFLGSAGAFAYLDDWGDADPREGLQLWITARMTHVYALGVLQDHPGADTLARQGVSALSDVFRDDEHDGWFSHLDCNGSVLEDRKAMYEHAFVLLAASTAVLADVPGAGSLLEDVAAVIDRRFWDEQAGACRESWDLRWHVTEGYRGANSNMHAVEAFLAAAQATGESRWTERALRIAERIVHHNAVEKGWRIPEHYTAEWQVLPEYNRDQPGHRFRPYGVTIGHMLEWSRLLLHVESALEEPPRWLVNDAESLFETALEIGWEADGRAGFTYTLDWNDRPVVDQRMHWVAVEGAMAANVLGRRTAREHVLEWERRLWRNAERFIDGPRGGWHHELDAGGRPSHVVWHGKPDIYHAVQAVLLPDLPFTPSMASSVLASKRTTATL